jgi:hypothetical protein
MDILVESQSLAMTEAVGHLAALGPDIAQQAPAVVRGLLAQHMDTSAQHYDACSVKPWQWAKPCPGEEE